MPKPFNNWTSWQIVYRRLLDWERAADACGNLSDHDPDLPYSRSEVALQVQQWCWQT
jgi:hypothetical protein